MDKTLMKIARKLLIVLKSCIFFSGVLCFIYFESRMNFPATIMIQTYLNKMFHVNALFMYPFIGDF